MIQRIYIDTSVVGGFFDTEFDLETKILFDKVFRQEMKLIVSDLLEAELIGAPEEIIKFYQSLPQPQLERVNLTLEAIELADKYILDGVVGNTSRTDCRHIALATISKADVLVSWNFKHIVNLKRIKGYNSVNLREGFQLLEIRSPKEIIEYED
jgi:predicted nucleic acid-binding protein